MDEEAKAINDVSPSGLAFSDHLKCTGTHALRSATWDLMPSMLAVPYNTWTSEGRRMTYFSCTPSLASRSSPKLLTSSFFILCDIFGALLWKLFEEVVLRRLGEVVRIERCSKYRGFFSIVASC